MITTFFGASTVRRLSYKGARTDHYGFWDVTVKKADLQRVGWLPRSQHDGVLFSTTADPSNKYCELQKWESEEKGLLGTYTLGAGKYPKSVHKIKWQADETVRIAPALNTHWEFMDRTDPNTKIEHDTDGDVLRIWYVPGLVPYQSRAMKGSVTRDLIT